MAGKPGMKGTKPKTVPEEYSPGWLEAVDRRYIPARRVASQLLELQDALGGPEVLSPQQKSLTERVVWLNMRLQQLEQHYLGGQGLDAGEYTTLIGSLTSVYRLLGMNRVVKRIPRALEYAAQVAANAQEARER